MTKYYYGFVYVVLMITFVSLPCLGSDESESNRVLLLEIIEKIDVLSSEIEKLKDSRVAGHDSVDEDLDSVDHAVVMVDEISDQRAADIFGAARFSYFGDEKDHSKSNKYDLTEAAINKGNRLLDQLIAEYPQYKKIALKLKAEAEEKRRLVLDSKLRIYIKDFTVALDTNGSVEDSNNASVKSLKSALGVGLDRTFNFVQYKPGVGIKPKFCVNATVVARNKTSAESGKMEYEVVVERVLTKGGEVRSVRDIVDFKSEIADKLVDLGFVINQSDEYIEKYNLFPEDLVSLRKLAGNRRYKDALAFGQKTLEKYSGIRNNEDIEKLKKIIFTISINRKRYLSHLYDELDNEKRSFQDAVEDKNKKAAKIYYNNAFAIVEEIENACDDVADVEEILQEMKEKKNRLLGR